MQVLLPDNWPRPKGYANGVSVSGRQIFISGMVGWDQHQRFLSQDLVGQVEQALHNVVAVLQTGGAQTQHIVRMTWYLTSRADYLMALPQIGTVFKNIIGHYDIAMTAVEVSALMEAEAQVEIEVTAVVPE